MKSLVLVAFIIIAVTLVMMAADLLILLITWILTHA